PLDEPLPATAVPLEEATVYARPWLELATAEHLSLRRLALRAAGALSGVAVRGSGAQIADVMEEWFTEGAADGFNVMPAFLPGALDDFVRFVVPELRRRGICRTEYEGRTL